MNTQSDMAWRRRVLREEAIMERGLTRSALIAGAPAGSWSAQGYSAKPHESSSKREGQTRALVGTSAQPRSLGRRETAASTPVRSVQASGHGRIHQGRGSEPLQQALGAGYQNPRLKSLTPGGTRPLGHPSLPGVRAGTPAASQKVSDWMTRSTGVEERQGSRAADDDVRSQRSGISAYSYSSGTSIQTYSGKKASPCALRLCSEVVD